jgi:hypothetical protein
MADKNTIKNWFRTNLKPTQAQFWATWDSFWHKDEKIPITAIDGIENILADKADAEVLTNHLTNATAHADLFGAKEDKNKRGVALGYAPLDQFTKLATDYLNVVNDLVTGGTSSVLTAEQGKLLQIQITAINTLLTSNDINLDTVQEIVNAIKNVQTSLSTILVNDLTTGGTTKALTAEMGKTLKGLINSLADNKISIFINSNESLSLAQRKGDVLYGILDQYTGEEMTLSKVTGTPSADNIIYFKLGAEYFKRNFEGFYIVKWFGAKGDGTADDTTAIQNAFNSIPSGNTLFFPSGIYKMTGSGDSCVTLSRNINILGDSTRGSTFRIDFASANTSALKIAINENGGFLDVRNWKMENVNIFHNNGGKHGVILGGVNSFPMVTCLITNCNIGGNSLNGGYGIYSITTGDWTHSTISFCTLDSIYANWGDANLIFKCLFLGSFVAVTYDLELGVYNNTIESCTITNKKGAMYVKNGSLIRFINNQVEHALSNNETNDSRRGAMIDIHGLARPCINIEISSNNLGGGTNVSRLIYIENAQYVNIEKNQLVACDIEDIFASSLSKYCKYSFNNNVLSQLSNPRLDGLFKAKITNESRWNINMPSTLVSGANLALSGWTIENPCWYKNESGRIIFYKSFQSGSTAVDTVLGQMFDGGLPNDIIVNVPVVSSLGIGIVKITNTNGYIQVVNLPSNSISPVMDYQSSTDIVDDIL